MQEERGNPNCLLVFFKLLRGFELSLHKKKVDSKQCPKTSLDWQRGTLFYSSQPNLESLVTSHQSLNI